MKSLRIFSILALAALAFAPVSAQAQNASTTPKTLTTPTAPAAAPAADAAATITVPQVEFLGYSNVEAQPLTAAEIEQARREAQEERDAYQRSLAFGDPDWYKNEGSLNPEE